MSYRIPQSKSLGFQGDLGHFECRNAHPLLQGVKRNVNQQNRFKPLSNTSRYSSPGTICLLPALLSDLNPAFLAPNECQCGLERALDCGAGGAKAAATMHALVYLMPCWNTTESCLHSQGCTCLQLGRGKKHQSPGRTGFGHICDNPITSPVLQTLECMRLLNWLKDYWFYF